MSRGILIKKPVLAAVAAVMILGATALPASAAKDQPIADVMIDNGETTYIGSTTFHLISDSRLGSAVLQSAGARLPDRERS
jgi:hypothetical protein